ncbi:hypothetical protein L484_011371 [Morus notabilis]|uniref:Uncharacterized protein n=1 Tax=Morus notabilis TaxID=981085 RepID=W9R5A9_9ROSA|nr:uncharacterized protein At4g38062 [Morus notabilis]EXB57285.1 hypothetical protein L484_011371 [Morus notabilis]
MEDVYNELDSVKAELERLKAEFQIKTELSESLKKANSEQLLKFKEAKQQIEKQSEEIKAKCEEIAEARKLSEKLESCLQEKEFFLRHLGSVNERVKDDLEQRLRTLEGENRDLVIALDEATARNKELERDVCASKEQIEGLKSLLSVTEKKCSEAEQMSQGAKELRQKDEVIVKLEEEKANFQDQLKWKKEQFKHLEEAHKRLQDQFQTSKEDWERGKSALIEKASSLEKRLDSQTRIAESLQSRLEMCNHALAHEESKRKSLEVQVSDFESCFENVFAQFQEEKSEYQRLIVQRIEEIAKMRSTLGMNETLAKEMEFKIVHLEQDNRELMVTLKELHEAQNRNGGATFSAKLNNKLRRLEQVHSECSAKLIEKESELLSQIEKIKGDVDSYKSELEGKEEEIKKLQMEVESSHSTIRLLNEEISLILEVFKSELSEAYYTTYNVKDEMELFNNEKEEKISLLIAKLETSLSALDIAQLELEEERNKVEGFTERVKSFEFMKQQWLLTEKELEKHKTLLDESTGAQVNLQKELQMESTLNNKELQMESTLNNGKEHLLGNEKTQIFKNERENLICIIEENVRKHEDLQLQIEDLESRLAEKAEDMEACLQDKENLVQTVKEKDICIDSLQKDIAMLKELRTRELEAVTIARLVVERAFMEEKEMLLKFIDEKEQTITNLKALATSLEQELTSAVMSSFTNVIENQVRIDALSEGLDRGKSVTYLEIEEKNKLIIHLEQELRSLRQRLTSSEESFFSLKQEVEQLQALVKTKKLETENMMDEQRRMDGILKELEFNKGVLLQDIMKLSTERENLLVYIQKVCDHIGKFLSDDVEMMKVLGKIFPRPEEETEPTMDGHNELYDSTGENVDTSFLATTKKLEANKDERLPLKELNQRQI